MTWYLIPLDPATEELALDDVTKSQTVIPMDILEIVSASPDEHPIDIRVRPTYNDTGTAEELYPTYVGEIE